MHKLEQWHIYFKTNTNATMSTGAYWKIFSSYYPSRPNLSINIEFTSVLVMKEA
jgi:hypothetical protein